jgi:DNA-binding NarL/FixJ family response regulator
MSSEIRVLIADDHPIFRHGLRQLIEKDPCVRVIAEADNGETALAILIAQLPEIAVLDVDMPKMDGFEVVRRLKKQALSTQIIFLTMHKDEMHLNEALSLEVKGYVIKDSAATDISNCIKAVVDGKSYVSAELTTHLLNRGRRSAPVAQGQPRVSNLTSTEYQILKLIAEYKTNREIAEALFISVRTVENHRANICSKLEIHGAHALMKFALNHKAGLP